MVGAISGGLATHLTGGDWRAGAVRGAIIGFFNHAQHEASFGGQDKYKNQYGKKPATLMEFAMFYRGKTENEIIYGEASFFGYKFPNRMNMKYQFLTLSNGREIDMIHFMVVGRRGHLLGVLNEVKQIFTSLKSAFYAQDLYSNKLGVTFFKNYGDLIRNDPNNIASYIYWYLSNPDNL